MFLGLDNFDKLGIMFFVANNSASKKSQIKNQSRQRLPVKGRTLKQVKILAALYGQELYVLAGRLVDAEWREALRMGLVNERMLEDVQLSREPVAYVQERQE